MYRTHEDFLLKSIEEQLINNIFVEFCYIISTGIGMMPSCHERRKRYKREGGKKEDRGERKGRLTYIAKKKRR
jgi:hypothetical protein